MTISIGDGTLEIPSSWHNSSINIFTAEPPGTPGPSLTVNRDQLDPGASLKEYADAQLEKLRTTLRRFSVVDERAVMLDGRPARLYEFTWIGEASEKMQQILLTTSHERRVMNLVATPGRKMDDPLRQRILAMLLSFRSLPQV